MSVDTWTPPLTATQRPRSPIEGAMLTVAYGDPIRALTVFTGEGGRFEVPPLASEGPFTVRVRAVQDRPDVHR